MAGPMWANSAENWVGHRQRLFPIRGDFDPERVLQHPRDDRYIGRGIVYNQNQFLLQRTLIAPALSA